MAATNLDAADLKAVPRGGLVREDVLDKIFQISPIDLPFMDMIGTDSCKNPYKEWTTDDLQAVNPTNAVVDGVDPVTGNNTALGKRVGNNCQISIKVVRVSERAQNVDTIGRSDELIYQLMQRQKELKRDMEAILTGIQASVADDGNTTAGKLGALGSWLKTNIKFGATGAAGGFDPATGLTVAPTPGTKYALTETAIRDMMEATYNNGGDPTILMSIPSVIRKISEYLFTSSARIATLQTTANKGDVKKVPGNADDLHQGVTAIGSVNVLVTDFGTLTLVPNRFLQTTTAGIAPVYGLDPAFFSVGYLQRPEVKPLAKTGLADNRVMSVDYTLIVKNEMSSFAIQGVDTAAAVTA